MRSLTGLERHVRLRRAWAISSVGERFPHTEEATGSIPVSPTIAVRVARPAGLDRLIRWTERTGWATLWPFAWCLRRAQFPRQNERGEVWDR